MCGLLFDLYGVFLTIQNSTYLRLTSEIGVDPEALRPLYEGPTRRDYDADILDTPAYWAKVGRALGVPIDWRHALRADLRSCSLEDETMVAYARELRAAGVPMAMLSNIPADFARNVRENRPWIAECFDPVVFSCDVRMVKPDPRIFDAAIDRLAEWGGRAGRGVDPGEVLYIDDTLDNVEVGAERGLAVHHFRGIEGLRRAVSDHLGR